MYTNNDHLYYSSRTYAIYHVTLYYQEDIVTKHEYYYHYDDKQEI